jgi:hypothetical protein
MRRRLSKCGALAFFATHYAMCNPTAGTIAAPM